MKILGLPFDNGIRSMLRFGRGTPGAKDGPKAVLDKLDYESEMLLLESFNIDDDIEKQQLATEIAHRNVEQHIRSLKEGFIAVGGDHSLTYPLIKGLRDRVAVVVLDAHFDMRPIEDNSISSGNAFYRLIEEGIVNELVYFGIDDSETDAFRWQRDYARSHNVGFSYDHEFNIEDISKALRRFDKIYVSIDIDALNKRYAPGVSAQNDKGINDEQLFDFIREIAKHNIIALDFMEISSRDGDKEALQKTAKLVVKAINLFIKHINPDNNAIL